MFYISCLSVPPFPRRPLSGTAHLPPHGNQDSFISCIKGFKPLTHSCPISISSSPGRSGGSVERWNRDVEGHGCSQSNSKKG